VRMADVELVAHLRRHVDADILGRAQLRPAA
jgi:hypothetical protein